MVKLTAGGKSFRCNAEDIQAIQETDNGSALTINWAQSPVYVRERPDEVERLRDEQMSVVNEEDIRKAIELAVTAERESCCQIVIDGIELAILDQNQDIVEVLESLERDMRSRGQNESDEEHI